MVVILIICIILVLVIYMTFLSCLDPILNKRRAAASTYQEQTNEEVSLLPTAALHRLHFIFLVYFVSRVWSYLEVRWQKFAVCALHG